MPSQPHGNPLVIAHRGASGYMPEHTLAGYATAILQGADFIEPDLMMTGDGHLIARHDISLERSTDVAEHRAFAARRTTKVVDGETITGWFSEDFALDEIRALRAVETLPDVRPGNARFDGQFGVPTLDEVLALARAFETLLNRPIGVYPETKHPTYFERLGLAMESPLVEVLHRNGYEHTPERAFIQSFEVSNLRRLHAMTPIPLVQLLGEGRPYDAQATGGDESYDRMAEAEGLERIAAYARGVGPHKHRLIEVGARSSIGTGERSEFVECAHAVGLVVHPYAFRAENRFLPPALRSAGGPNDPGDLAGEVRLFVQLGVDGLFTDHSDIAVRAREALRSQAL